MHIDYNNETVILGDVISFDELRLLFRFSMRMAADNLYEHERNSKAYNRIIDLVHKNPKFFGDPRGGELVIECAANTLEHLVKVWRQDYDRQDSK
jgi:hypothetical protein